jgi:hypothetical protein
MRPPAYRAAQIRFGISDQTLMVIVLAVQYGRQGGAGGSPMAERDAQQAVTSAGVDTGRDRGSRSLRTDE